MTRKTSKATPRPPTLSNSLTVKAGPTGMQKVLKQNLHKIVIYVNKPRLFEGFFSVDETVKSIPILCSSCSRLCDYFARFKICSAITMYKLWWHYNLNVILFFIINKNKYIIMVLMDKLYFLLLNSLTQK